MKLPWGGITGLFGLSPQSSTKSTYSASPLYKYDEFRRGDKRRAHFFTTTAHSQYIDSIGHPWCSQGFGDAFTMALTQLLKSEVSLVLSNAAAEFTPNRSELVYDSQNQAYAVLTNNSLSVPGLPRPPDESIFPQHTPTNSVTWSLLMGIVNKIFDDSRLGQKLRSITDQLCQLSDAEAAASPMPDNVYFCFMEDIVAALLICGESEQAVNCQETMEAYRTTQEDFPDAACVLSNTSLYRPYIPNEFFFRDTDLEVPLLLVDVLQGTREHKLPRKIPDAIIEQEALTYLILFRGLIIASAFSRKPYLCGADKIHTPLLFPGWRLPFVVTSKQEGDPVFKEGGLKRDAIPLAFVSQSNINPCAFIITVRGTASMFEWTADFQYSQTPWSQDGDILVHSGFNDLIATICPLVESYIRSATEKNNCACKDTHLIFTGHSLGAGVSQLMALYFAQRYGLESCGADISGVFYAPPRSFNLAGVESYAKLVNGRVILDVGDGLAYMPCYDGNSAYGWPRCTKGHMSKPGVGRDFYADNFGLVEIDVDFSERGGKGIDAVMQTIFPSGERNKPSAIGTLFTKLFETSIPGLSQVPSLGMLGAAHVCSFACKYSQMACGYNFQWWCERCPMLL